jgi:hypothetical protein
VSPEKILEIVNAYHLASHGTSPMKKDDKSSWAVHTCRETEKASYPTRHFGFGATFEEAVEDWARQKWPAPKKKKVTKRKRTIKESKGKGTVSREAVRKAVRKVKAERDE